MKIRSNISRFSIVSPYWTDITYSEDPEVWKDDLKEHLKEKNINNDWKTFFDLNPCEKYGGFGLDINSLEELEDLSKYFNEHGFPRQLIKKYQETKKKRLWFNLGNDGPKEEPWGEENCWGCNLFLYPIEWTQENIIKLRTSLLELWRIGYLLRYKNDLYY